MAKRAEILYLVDGDGLLYRAANALPYFTNKAGLPTNALHGFAAMMRILLQTHSPSHMAVAFTSDPPLRRHALDPDYKVNHYEHPEEIKRQLPYAVRLVAALGLHPFLETGYEADDVIATLLHEYRRMAARILSSDRDFYQFASSRVHMLVPVRGTSELREVGPADVQASFGVRPAQIPDLKALVGDASDDIPGVPGIGIKTGAALLGTFTTVERLLNNLDLLANPGTPARLATARERLASMRERVLLNKRLALLSPVRLRKRSGD
ncbi:MAG: 5'-3' exonuclease, partial [bacterium]